MLPATIFIRTYRPDDRDVVRMIACDTADRGEPVESFFRDRETFADLLTRYYTDWEPQSLWVAEVEGRVIGYLTGCLNTHRYWTVMQRRIIPRAVWGAVCRGALRSYQTWRVLRAGVQTLAVGRMRREASSVAHPAHLHLNVAKAFRSQRVGRQLLERFLAQARAAGSPGVHAAVREDNDAGKRFFERMGFTVLGRYPVVRPDAAGGHSGETIVYGTSW